MKKNTKTLTQSAVIAALYIVFTLLSNAFGLSGGAVQCRLSEMLYALALFTPSAVYGLFIGCLLSNIITNGIILDIILGSIATLIGAFFAHKLRANPFLALSMPIISNSIIIPLVLRYGYGYVGTLPYFVLTVTVGEIISCGILGILLFQLLKKHSNIF